MINIETYQVEESSSVCSWPEASANQKQMGWDKGCRWSFNAIRSMVVRGAPLIGVVAAFGLALELEKHSLSSREEFVSKANE